MEDTVQISESDFKFIAERLKFEFHEEVQVVDDMFNTNETDQQIRLSHFQTENGTKWFAKEQTNGTDSI